MASILFLSMTVGGYTDMRGGKKVSGTPDEPDPKRKIRHEDGLTEDAKGRNSDRCR